MTTPQDNATHSATERSTTELAMAIQSGDLQAEEILVQRFARGLQMFIRIRLGCPRELVDDLHQDCLRIALERLRGRGLDEPEALAGFLRGIARQLLLNERRRQARRRTDTDEEALAQTVDHRPGPLSNILDVETAQLVRSLIHTMDAQRDREILHRFYIAEDPKDSICRDLGLSSLNFNVVLFRARQRFKELLEDFRQQEGSSWHLQGTPG